MKSNNSNSELLIDIKAVWRLLLLVVIAQLTGAAINLLISDCSVIFVALWYGGALATPIGFILGLAWQWSQNPSSIKDNAAFVGFLGALSAGLFLMALLMGQSMCEMGV